MSKVIAVFGAGTGLGAAVARRFGTEGYTVALIARRLERLAALTEDLTAQGVQAVPFAADLSDHHAVPALIDSITERLGHIDVVEYGPISGDQAFIPAKDLDAQTLQDLTPLLLLTPVEVVRAVLPAMLERGQGTILLTQGSFAVQPLPFLSGPGPVMAAARNYVHSLNGELAGTGVYAGTLAISASIEGSEMATLAAHHNPEAAAAMPSINPDELAEIYWQMHLHRDTVEVVHPTHAPAGTAS